MHPDGVILSTGNEASVCKMWDLKDQSCVCTFTGHTNGSITAIAFSENGYYLATAAEDQTIKLCVIFLVLAHAARCMVFVGGICASWQTSRRLSWKAM